MPIKQSKISVISSPTKLNLGKIRHEKLWPLCQKPKPKYAPKSVVSRNFSTQKQLSSKESRTLKVANVPNEKCEIIGTTKGYLNTLWRYVQSIDDCIKAYKKAVSGIRKKGSKPSSGGGDWRPRLMEKDREIDDLHDKISSLERQLKKQDKKLRGLKRSAGFQGMPGDTGTDGRVRVVELKIGTETMTRPVNKMCKINEEMDNWVDNDINKDRITPRRGEMLEPQ